MRTMRPIRCFVGPHRFVTFCVMRHMTEQNATFWGLRTLAGAMTSKFELGRDFCAVHLRPKFHYPMFTRSEVIVLTHRQTHKSANKQTPPKKSNVLRYATTLGNYSCCGSALFYLECRHPVC